MKNRTQFLFFVLASTLGLFSMTIGSEAAAPEKTKKAPAAEKKAAEEEEETVIGVDEARRRAQLLHETFHTTLRVIHSRYYREDEGLTIPSRSLEMVFGRLARLQKVKLRWLAVNAQAMDIDHNPRDKFEKSAVKALSKGEKEYERVEDGIYKHVGTIRLSSQCLKCHLPNRRSTRDRTAGLVISMPVKSD